MLPKYLLEPSKIKSTNIWYQYSPQPHTNKNKIEVQLDLSNYATKFGIKNTTGIDTSQFAKTDDLANIKSDVGE